MQVLQWKWCWKFVQVFCKIPKKYRKCQLFSRNLFSLFSVFSGKIYTHVLYTRENPWTCPLQIGKLTNSVGNKNLRQSRIRIICFYIKYSVLILKHPVYSGKKHFLIQKPLQKPHSFSWNKTKASLSTIYLPGGFRTSLYDIHLYNVSASFTTRKQILLQ